MTGDPEATFGPLGPFVSNQGFLVLDGGLATELEARGIDLGDDLWSARALLDAPDAIRSVSLAYLEAGADCIATASYQATFEGFRRCGLEDDRVTELLRRSVELAVEARRDFWEDPSFREGRLAPLIAASIGPYGAFLADGSEYRGDYGATAADLYDFHARRWETLAETDADLMGCETTPSIEETLAYCRLAAVSGRPTWISFQCRDDAHIADGTPLAEAAAVCQEEPNVVAIGVNCTDPRWVSSLIGILRGTTDKPILAYPNAGEGWDAEGKRWTGPATPIDWAQSASAWRRHGAFGVGGCCRVGPSQIAAIRTSLTRSAESPPGEPPRRGGSDAG